MSIISKGPAGLFLLAILTSGSAYAQPQDAPGGSIVVNGEAVPDTANATPGPVIQGIISARSGDRMQVTAADGARTIVAINDATRIKASTAHFRQSDFGWSSAQARSRVQTH